MLSVVGFVGGILVVWDPKIISKLDVKLGNFSIPVQLKKNCKFI